jgi:hypothetical protein
MSLDNVAAVGGSEQIVTPITDIAVHIPGGDGPLSVRDAVRSLADWRRKSVAGADGVDGAQNTTGQEAGAPSATADPAAQAAVAAQAAKPQSDPAQAGDDTGDRRDPPGETASQDAEVERRQAAETLPPVEPPRSWSKEDKELFTGLPRDTQERLAERERSRDSDFSRRQQEATERAKALEAERGKVEQARGQYEQALPILLSNLQSAYSGEFADVRTMDDVQKLAVSDPIRYTQWDAAQKRMAAVHQEIVSSQQRQMIEREQLLNHYRAREAELFAEKAPEFSDPVKAKQLMDGAVTVLRDLGFQDQELGEMWRGERDISIHDHRLHLLLRDGIKWRDANARAKSVQAAKVPPVQRPGVAQPKGAAREAELANLTKQLDNSRGNNQLRAAAALVAARRRAAG